MRRTAPDGAPIAGIFCDADRANLQMPAAAVFVKSFAIGEMLLARKVRVRVSWHATRGRQISSNSR
jgi:hypothetical protein